ncbi:MAG: protein kinase [Candidatus Obscuribacter sp.]|nr:protein kinase [Candidatus Obscuribacter sp.]
MTEEVLKEQQQSIKLKIAESAAESIDDPLSLVKQSKKVRPSADLIMIAELVDLYFLGLLGSIISALAVGLCAIITPGAISHLPQVMSCTLAGAIFGFVLFFLSGLLPIFFPLALVVLQIAGRVTVGTVALDCLTSWLGLPAGSMGSLSAVAAPVLTLIFSILPVLASPLYFAVMLSSRFQTTLGWSLAGLMVCGQDGKRASFAQAFKRSLLRLLWPILLPGNVVNSVLVDEWVEAESKTVLMLKPHNLKAEILISRDNLRKSKERIVVKSQPGPLHHSKKDSSHTLSTGSIRRLLKRDWQSTILRTESILIVILGVLFLMRFASLYWTNRYFSGIVSTVAMPAWIEQVWLSLSPFAHNAVVIGIPLLYLLAFLYAAKNRPQVLELTADGVSLAGSERIPLKKLHRWSDIIHIHLEEGTGKLRGQNWMVFATSNGKPIKARLDLIKSVDVRDEILQALTRWAPNVPRDLDLVKALEPPCDYSYTDVWMEALTAPPKRDKLKPLIADAVLHDSQYIVQQCLAVGGQGSVYLAEDRLSSRDVVLKEFVLPVYVDIVVRRKAIERFEKEARLLKGLEHGQIVKLLDFFVEDHRAYLVLEHLRGKNLRELVRQNGPLPEKEVGQLALQMCRILKYLHNQNPAVIHRDFTPENLILGDDGILRLIDFNVAQSLEAGATTTGTVVGKPSYVPPEQFRGNPSTQSDIYAMGATLAYLLSGHDPLPLSQSHPADTIEGLSIGMDLLVATCTNGDAELRYKDISEVEKAVLETT